ncbi:MAG: OmpH family outer membrane protein [Balneola sp.]
MNSFKIFGLVGITVLGFIFSQSNNQKVGHINSNLLLGIMPEYESAKSNLQGYADGFEDQLQDMQDDAQLLWKEFEKEGISDEEKKELSNKINLIQSEMEKFSSSSQEKINNKEKELVESVLEKANRAISKVASENGYSYIIDYSTGALLHAEESTNIMPLVKAELGI